jgi:hypothetical protein
MGWGCIGLGDGSNLRFKIREVWLVWILPGVGQPCISEDHLEIWIDVRHYNVLIPD